MRPGVSLGVMWWCPGVSWGVLGLSDRPIQLIQLSTNYSFHNNLLYFLRKHLQSSRPYK